MSADANTIARVAEHLRYMKGEIDRADKEREQVHADTTALLARWAVRWQTWQRWLDIGRHQNEPRPIRPARTRDDVADEIQRRVSEADRALLVAEMRYAGAYDLATVTGILGDDAGCPTARN